MIENNLNCVRVGYFFIKNNFVNQCGHDNGRIINQRLDNFVYLHRLKNRLIALNIDDDCIGGKIQRFTASDILSVPERWVVAVITALPPNFFTASNIL